MTVVYVRPKVIDVIAMQRECDRYGMEEQKTIVHSFPRRRSKDTIEDKYNGTKPQLRSANFFAARDST